MQRCGFPHLVLLVAPPESRNFSIIISSCANSPRARLNLNQSPVNTVRGILFRSRIEYILQHSPDVDRVQLFISHPLKGRLCINGVNHKSKRRTQPDWQRGRVETDLKLIKSCQGKTWLFNTSLLLGGVAVHCPQDRIHLNLAGIAGDSMKIKWRVECQKLNENGAFNKNSQRYQLYYLNEAGWRVGCDNTKSLDGNLIRQSNWRGPRNKIKIPLLV